MCIGFASANVLQAVQPARKVFSAAALKVDGRDAGYVYVVLFGEERDTLAAGLAADRVLRSALWSMGLVALLGLLAGLAAFHLITRPLRQLTDVAAGGMLRGELHAPAVGEILRWREWE